MQMGMTENASLPRWEEILLSLLMKVLNSDLQIRVMRKCVSVRGIDLLAEFKHKL